MKYPRIRNCYNLLDNQPNLYKIDDGKTQLCMKTLQENFSRSPSELVTSSEQWLTASVEGNFADQNSSLWLTAVKSHRESERKNKNFENLNKTDQGRSRNVTSSRASCLMRRGSHNQEVEQRLEHSTAKLNWIEVVTHHHWKQLSCFISLIWLIETRVTLLIILTLCFIRARSLH